MEVSILLALASYHAPLSSIGSILHPTQEMANEVSEAMAKAKAFPPPYKPYIAPDYSIRPWLPRMDVHTNALNKWKTRVTRVQGKQELSFQMRLRHHMRFVVTADLCHAWDSFGGMAAQLPQITLLLSLAATENFARAMLYRKEIVRFLSESARARITLNFRSYLSEVKGDILKMAPGEIPARSNQPRQFPRCGSATREPTTQIIGQEQ